MSWRNVYSLSFWNMNLLRKCNILCKTTSQVRHIRFQDREEPIYLVEGVSGPWHAPSTQSYNEEIQSIVLLLSLSLRMAFHFLRTVGKIYTVHFFCKKVVVITGLFSWKLREVDIIDVAKFFMKSKLLDLKKWHHLIL